MRDGALRLIIHAGFHKTGTSSLQRTLAVNRAALAPYLRLYLREDMLPLCEAARAYSARPEPIELGLFGYEVAQFLDALGSAGFGSGGPNVVVLSSEDLAGHMPGRHNVWGYDHAPRLMRHLSEITVQYADEAGLDTPAPLVPEFWFTTRHRDGWIDSCYAQNVRATRFTMTRNAYRTAMTAPGQRDTAGEVARLRDFLDQPVAEAAIEDIGGHRLGPAAALLRFAGVAPAVMDGLQIHPHRNASLPRDMIDQLLDLNQSDLDDSTLIARKKALIAEHEAGLRRDVKPT